MGEATAHRADLRGAVAIGDEVVAEDGTVGHVEEVVRTESRDPRFVVVRARRGLVRRHPVVPVDLVTSIDPRARRIRVRGRRASVAALPETVPFVL